MRITQFTVNRIVEVGLKDGGMERGLSDAGTNPDGWMTVRFVIPVFTP